MRSYEMILTALNLATLVLLVVVPRPTRKLLGVLCAISVSAFLLHASLEGIRIEMTLVYLLGLIPVIAWFRMTWEREVKKRRSGVFYWVRRVTGLLAALIYVVVAVVIPAYAFPVFTFEKLTGPYKVGTEIRYWVDSTREQVHAKEPGTERELPIQIWYPADPEIEGTRKPYIDHPGIFEKAISQNQKMPGLFYSSLKLVQTHSISDVPLAGRQDKYPVIIFSHGNTGWPGQNTYLVEQLASHGYIVVGVEHAGSANVSVLSDGRVIPYYPDAGQTLDNGAFDRLVDEVWIKDIRFVLDELERLNVKDVRNRFVGHLDLDRIGMIGYSLGGATTVQILLTDGRVKAGINMDGGFYGKERVEGGINRPFMLMSADSTFSKDGMTDEQLSQLGLTKGDYAATIDELLTRQKHAATGGNYVLTIKNTDHSSFSDLPLYSPLMTWLQGGDARKVHRLVNDFALTFLDQSLKGKPSAMLKDSVGGHADYMLKRE